MRIAVGASIPDDRSSEVAYVEGGATFEASCCAASITVPTLTNATTLEIADENAVATAHDFLKPSRMMEEEVCMFEFLIQR
jgi:hypothetical protein